MDRDDLTEWLTEAGAAQLPNGTPYLYGDLDFDDVDNLGVVDFATDWDVWHSNKFTDEQGYCNADYNTDGIVDVQDFQIVAANMLQFSDPAIGVGFRRSAAWITCPIYLRPGLGQSVCRHRSVLDDQLLH